MGSAEIDVEAGGARYKISCGPGLLTTIGSVLGDIRGRVALVADRALTRIHDRAIHSLVKELSAHVIEFNSGENAKSIEALAEVWAGLAVGGVGRDGVIVAIGGGVATDLGGFAAATWMRGIPYVNVPTSLEAAIDAAVGGKTAINLPAGKNLVGAFHQPLAVVIDTDLLATLPQREHVAALAEAVKHAVVRDGDFLTWQEDALPAILERDAPTLAAFILRNCRIKADVVRQDEREGGLREVLNYGHTIGHAIEHVAGFSLRHGECVAIGMVAENVVAVERGVFGQADSERVRAMLEAAGLPTGLPPGSPQDAILRATQLDKKNRAGCVRCALPTRIGAALTVEVTEDELRRAIAAVA